MATGTTNGNDERKAEREKKKQAAKDALGQLRKAAGIGNNADARLERFAAELKTGTRTAKNGKEMALRVDAVLVRTVRLVRAGMAVPEEAKAHADWKALEQPIVAYATAEGADANKVLAALGVEGTKVAQDKPAKKHQSRASA